MRRLTVFNNVTADGYFSGANGDMTWAHHLKLSNSRTFRNGNVLLRYEALA